MNAVVIDLLWCVVQVSAFSAVALLLYFATRGFDRRLAVHVLMISLLVVAVLTTVVFAPAVHWSWEGNLWGSQASIRADFQEVEHAVPPPGSEPNARLDFGPGSATSPTAVSRSQLPATGDSASAEIGSPTGNRDITQRLLQIPWPALVVTLAGAVVVVGIGRLLAAGVALRTYRRTGSRVDDAGLQQTASAIAHRLGLARAVPLCESDRIASPATIGWRKPLILLPPAWRSWTLDERSAVLAHELAHVRLRHFPKWLFSQLVLTVHYYHPLIHWLARRLRLEQELAADDHAAAALGSRQQYSAALATLVLRPSSAGARAFGPGLFMSHALLMRRLQMLRRPATDDRQHSRFPQLLALLLVVGVGIAVSGIRSVAQPVSADVDQSGQLGEPDDAGAEELGEIDFSQPAARPEEIARQLVTRIQSSTSDVEREQLVELLSKLLAPHGYEDLVASEQAWNQVRRELSSANPAKRSHVVTALFQVSSQEPSLLSQRDLSFDQREWDNLRATQLALIKSHFVLIDAFRNPKIGQLPLVAAQRDPVTWLSRELHVEFIEGSEILSIKLYCNEDDVSQCRKIVDAVADAYINQVIFADRKKHLTTRDLFAKSLAKINDEIRRKMEDFQSLAEELGTAEFGGQPSVLQQIDMRRLERVEDELMKLSGDLLSAELVVNAARESHGDDNPEFKQAQSQFQFLTKRQAQLEQRREELVEQVTSRGGQSVELNLRQRELEHLQQIANQMALKIESWDVELVAPQRIKLIQPAQVSLVEDPLAPSVPGGRR